MLLLASLSGCISSSGLLFRPGPHKQLHSAKSMAKVAGNPLPLPRELSKSLQSEHRVEPGDVLAIETASYDAKVRFPGDQPVLPNGTIDLGALGEMLVAGKTVAEVERDVQLRVDRSVEAFPDDDLAAEDATASKVNVRLVEPQGSVFYVLGEVNSPGSYPVKGNETALDAILEAGDLTDRADRMAIVLSRPTHPTSCRLVLPVCYHQIVQLGDTSTNYQIRPGDRIYVPSLTFWNELWQSCFPGRMEDCPTCPSPQCPCPESLLDCGPECGSGPMGRCLHHQR
jgi:protein involved in polysaccharide export with SLBB domain